MEKAQLTSGSYFLPPEWHEQSGVMLTWPHAETDWADYLDDITRTFVELTAAIARHEQVIVAAQDTEAVSNALTAAIEPQLLERVRIVPCPTNDTWARDHGPITLLPTDSNTNGNDALLLDFRFNGWGEKFEWKKDNAITATLCEKGCLKGHRENHDDFVLEGGSIETDGHGTVFTTSACLNAPHRNQPLTRNEIESELLRRLRADRIVWIDHGLLVGDDTDGHIDTLVRTAPEDTLLYVGSGPDDDPQHDGLAEMEQQLLQLRTAEGKPYRLLRLPAVAPVWYDGERLPATYANFLVVNGAVIVPTYNQPEADNEAIATIAKAYPGREMVAIDARTIVRQHGSIHCLTMQLPAGVLR